MLVKTVMNKNVITVNPETEMKEIASIMSDNHVGSVIVVMDKKPVGIITERDIVNALAEGRNIEKTKVKDIMTQYLITVKSEDEVKNAIETMRDNKIKKVPVINEMGELVGILTATDLVELQPKIFKIVRKMK